MVVFSYTLCILFINLALSKCFCLALSIKVIKFKATLISVNESFCDIGQRINIFSAVVKQPVGGDMIAEQCRLMLEEQKIDVVPSYKIASKVSFLLIFEQYLVGKHACVYY